MGVMYEKEFIEWLVRGWEGNEEEFKAYKEKAKEIYYDDFEAMYGDLKQKNYSEEEIAACMDVMKMLMGM